MNIRTVLFEIHEDYFNSQNASSLKTFIGCFKGEIYIQYVAEIKTWKNARKYCLEQDQTLFDLVNGNLELALLDAFPNIFPTNPLGFWVGVKKIDDVWRSFSGKDVENFVKWNDGEPSGGKNAIYMRFNVEAYHETGFYAHDSLNTRNTFFCYKWCETKANRTTGSMTISLCD